RKKEGKRVRRIEKEEKERKETIRTQKDLEAMAKLEKKLLVWKKPDDPTAETLVEKIILEPEWAPGYEPKHCISLNVGTDENPDIWVVIFDSDAIKAYDETLAYWRQDVS